MNNPTATAGSNSRIWQLVLLLGALSAFGPLSIDMYLPALPNLATELATTTSLTQLSLTACLLGMALGQIFAGPFSDIHGRRRPLLVGLIIYSLASLLCAMAPSIEIFIILRFIQGFAGATGVVIARASSRDLYTGSELTKFFAMLMLVNGSAPILAPLIGGQLLQFTSWRGIFLVLAVIGIIMLIAVGLNHPETLPTERRSRGGLTNTLTTIGSLLTQKAFMGYALCQGFTYAALFTYISGSPFVIQTVYGGSPQLFSFCFAINGLGVIIASQATGRMAGRLAEQSLLKIGLIIAWGNSLLLLYLIYIQASLTAILIPLFFIIASMGITNTSSFALAMQNQAQSAGSAAALLGLTSYILGGIAAPGAGFAGSHTALPMAIIIALAETAAVLTYLLLLRQRQTT